MGPLLLTLQLVLTGGSQPEAPDTDRDTSTPAPKAVTVGRTDASMTSGGNVASIWLKNSVQENVRLSMSMFASLAAATTSDNSFLSMPDRI